MKPIKFSLIILLHGVIVTQATCQDIDYMDVIFGYLPWVGPSEEISFELCDSAHNLWEIGNPVKSNFNAPLDGENVIVTDLDSLYSPGNYSCFVIKAVSGKPYEPCWSIFHVGFYHKLKTDSIKAGGYIEISTDDGATWNNVIEEDTLENYSYLSSTNLYKKTDTLFNGQPGFSGKIGDWTNSWVSWYSILYQNRAPFRNIFIRFVFVSSEDSKENEGWMIDNIYLDAHDECISDINLLFNDKEKVLINHKNHFRIFLPEGTTPEYELKIYDLKGTLRYTSGVSCETEFDLTLPVGIYFYRLTVNNHLFTDKIIIKP